MSIKYPEIQMLIGGKWRGTAKQDPIINPVDESTIGTVPHATTADLDDAVAAAAAGFKVWRATSPAKRAEILLKAVDLIVERADDIAYAITLEQGKPLPQAKLEVLRSGDTFEWEATECRRAYGRVIPAEAGMRHMVLRQPIGVVAGFAPWNAPINSPGRMVSAALAAGCAMILKPSEETPAGANMMAQALMDAGLPPGVLNVVYGSPAEISAYLIPKPEVRLITFTGSVPVGKHLASLAGAHMKPVVMELGGHGPVIICDDVDPVATAKTAAVAKYRNGGQVCTAPTRFFVHEKIFNQFVDAFVEKVNTIKVGDGMEKGVEIGPMANMRRVEAMDEFVKDATAKGAKLKAGGKRIGNKGYFYPATVLVDVPETARVMFEEPFGPIALINPVKSLDEAIEKANSLPYGLTAYAFTNSSKNVYRMTEGLEVGNLSINHFTSSVAETPFGGVKNSGYGRAGGVEGQSGYTIVKNVSHLQT